MTDAFSGDPTYELPVHGWLMEQVPVVHTIADPLPGCGKGQTPGGVMVTAQGAVQRYEPISEKPGTQAVSLTAAGGRHGVALHSIG